MERVRGVLIDDSPLTMELEQVARTAIKNALAGYDLRGAPERLFIKHKAGSREHRFELWAKGADDTSDTLISSAIVDAKTKQAQVAVHGLSRARDEL